MKTTLALALAALSLPSTVLAGSENYLNFVRQYQQGTGVYWDRQNVDAKGKDSSLAALEEGGALFQLWTIEKNVAQDYLLDQKTVGAYLPKAVIEIKTLDPYEKIHRTRADQPFSVNITVSDLLTGTSNLPQAASSVLAEHHVATYANGQTTIAATKAISGKPFASGYITANGLTPFDFAQSTLQPANGKNPVGEEHFVVHALSDGSLSQTQIAADFVQVWPVATGTIEGLEKGQKIAYAPPRLTLVLSDLYPGSYTYLRVREQASGYEAIFEQSKYVLAEEPTDTGKLITLSDYGDMFPNDGTYTLELVTVTPFGIEILSSASVPVDRVLQINGQLSGLDSN